MTLLEVVISISLLSVIGGSLVGALYVGSMATYSAKTMTTAESLSRTAMESVKAAPWAEGDPPDYSSVETDVNGDAPAGYSIGIAAELIEEDIQKITISVSFDGEEVVSTEGYKGRPQE